jgi:hypothetical protein
MVKTIKRGAAPTTILSDGKDDVEEITTIVSTSTATATTG